MSSWASDGCIVDMLYVFARQFLTGHSQLTMVFVIYMKRYSYNFVRSCSLHSTRGVASEEGKWNGTILHRMTRWQLFDESWCEIAWWAILCGTEMVVRNSGYNDIDCTVSSTTSAVSLQQQPLHSCNGFSSLSTTSSSNTAFSCKTIHLIIYICWPSHSHLSL